MWLNFRKTICGSLTLNRNSRIERWYASNIDRHVWDMTLVQFQSHNAYQFGVSNETKLQFTSKHPLILQKKKTWVSPDYRGQELGFFELLSGHVDLMVLQEMSIQWIHLQRESIGLYLFQTFLLNQTYSGFQTTGDFVLRSFSEQVTQ